MNRSKKILPFTGEINRADNTGYHKILNLAPTLRSQVAQALEEKSRSIKTIDYPLPTNDAIISDLELEVYIEKLISTLNQLLLFTGGKKPIVVVKDSCFTNNLLEASLLRIF
jgi:hypothetical protein